MFLQKLTKGLLLLGGFTGQTVPNLALPIKVRESFSFVTTPTQPQLNLNSTKVGFDTKMTLHTPPPTTHHRNSNFTLTAIQGNINQCQCQG